MASSGSFTTTAYDSRRLQFSWAEKSQNVETNKTVITWTLKAVGTGEHTLYNAGNFKVTIDGKQVYFSSTRITTKDGLEIASGEYTFTHNADGSKSFTAYAEAGIYTYAVNCTGSKSFTLDPIPRKATISSAPNFNDEANPVIKYSNQAGGAVTKLEACISLTGAADDIAYRDISKTGTSYTFNLTTAERNVLRNATTGTSRKVRFYIQTTIGSTVYRDYVEKTLSIVNAAPTVNPTVKDSNSITASLTGNNDTLIRYFSNAAITFGASALKGATIKSRTCNNGGKVLSADGTLSAVESGTFSFKVVDSRGLTTSKTVTKPIVNYVKLTCAINNPSFNTDGVITFSIKGNYFNGSFGAVSNVLIVRYRIKTNSGSFGSWQNVEATLSGNTYTANVSISGLDYREKYIIQAGAIDELATINTANKTFTCVPVFDWGEDDFNFNVPVTLNHNGNTYNLLGLLFAMTTTYELDCTVSPGANYTGVTATAHLVGGNLRIGISAERNAAVNVGNVTNETVCTLLINHGGKLNNLYRVSFNSSTEGGAATFDAQAAKVDDNVYRVTINLCATTTAATGWNAYFAMPCSIVTKAYV